MEVYIRCRFFHSHISLRIHNFLLPAWNASSFQTFSCTVSFPVLERVFFCVHVFCISGTNVSVYLHFHVETKRRKKTFEVASSLSFFFLIPVTTGTRNNHFGVCKVCFLLKKTGAYKNVTSPDQVVAFPWTILWPFCFFCVFFFRNNLCLFYFCIVCV